MGRHLRSRATKLQQLMGGCGDVVQLHVQSDNRAVPTFNGMLPGWVHRDPIDDSLHHGHQPGSPLPRLAGHCNVVAADSIT